MLYVFIRGPNKRDKKLVEDMLGSIEVKDYELVDVNAVDVTTLERRELGVAFGRICGRIVKEKTDRLFVFPPTKDLYRAPENKDHRLRAKDLLQELKEAILNPPEVDKQKDVALGAFLQTQKGSIYVSNMTHEEAQEKSDLCLTVDDIEYIDDLCDIFGADTVQIITEV